MSGGAPIQVKDLCHSYGKGELKKQILFDISTEIRPGEIVIVTGPSSVSISASVPSTASITATSTDW